MISRLENKSIFEKNTLRLQKRMIQMLKRKELINETVPNDEEIIPSLTNNSPQKNNNKANNSIPRKKEFKNKAPINNYNNFNELKKHKKLIDNLNRTTPISINNQNKLNPINKSSQKKDKQSPSNNIPLKNTQEKNEIFSSNEKSSKMEEDNKSESVELNISNLDASIEMSSYHNTNRNEDVIDTSNNNANIVNSNNINNNNDNKSNININTKTNVQVNDHGLNTNNIINTNEQINQENQKDQDQEHDPLNPLASLLNKKTINPGTFIHLNNNLVAKAACNSNKSTPSYILALFPDFYKKKNSSNKNDISCNYAVNNIIKEENENETPLKNKKFKTIIKSNNQISVNNNSIKSNYNKFINGIKNNKSNANGNNTSINKYKYKLNNTYIDSSLNYSYLLNESSNEKAGGSVNKQNELIRKKIQKNIMSNLSNKYINEESIAENKTFTNINMPLRRSNNSKSHNLNLNTSKNSYYINNNSSNASKSVKISNVKFELKKPNENLNNKNKVNNSNKNIKRRNIKRNVKASSCELDKKELKEILNNNNINLKEVNVYSRHKSPTNKRKFCLTKKEKNTININNSSTTKEETISDINNIYSKYKNNKYPLTNKSFEKKPIGTYKANSFFLKINNTKVNMNKTFVNHRHNYSKDSKSSLLVNKNRKINSINSYINNEQKDKNKNKNRNKIISNTSSNKKILSNNISNISNINNIINDTKEEILKKRNSYNVKLQTNNNGLYISSPNNQSLSVTHKDQGNRIKNKFLFINCMDKSVNYNININNNINFNCNININNIINGNNNSNINNSITPNHIAYSHNININKTPNKKPLSTKNKIKKYISNYNYDSYRKSLKESSLSGVLISPLSKENSNSSNKNIQNPNNNLNLNSNDNITMSNNDIKNTPNQNQHNIINNPSTPQINSNLINLTSNNVNQIINVNQNQSNQFINTTTLSTFNPKSKNPSAFKDANLSLQIETPHLSNPVIPNTKLSAIAIKKTPKETPLINKKIDFFYSNTNNTNNTFHKENYKIKYQSPFAIKNKHHRKTKTINGILSKSYMEASLNDSGNLNNTMNINPSSSNSNINLKQNLNQSTNFNSNKNEVAAALQKIKFNSLSNYVNAFNSLRKSKGEMFCVLIYVDKKYKQISFKGLYEVISEGKEMNYAIKLYSNTFCPNKICCKDAKYFYIIKNNNEFCKVSNSNGMNFNKNTILMM